MRFLHAMVRISDVPASLHFYCDGLGLEEVRRVDVPSGKFTLIFLASPDDLKAAGADAHDFSKSALMPGVPMVELTHNWDEAEYEDGRNFGHLAFQVDDIYAVCEHLVKMGVIINRPPRDGRMAFVRSPDGISVELLQKGVAQEPKEPWASAENIGAW